MSHPAGGGDGRHDICPERSANVVPVAVGEQRGCPGRRQQQSPAGRQ